MSDDTPWAWHHRLVMEDGTVWCNHIGEDQGVPCGRFDGVWTPLYPRSEEAP